MNGGEALPLAGQIEASQLMATQRQVAVAGPGMMIVSTLLRLVDAAQRKLGLTGTRFCWVSP